eukprot:GHUV01019614.1.p1 GENE.GHUV01019614.1~~GHUV01019614.1.p1  ORF type:complete len:911 (+),score=211.03 GHUV01019614.1:148-2880(+)
MVSKHHLAVISSEPVYPELCGQLQITVENERRGTGGLVDFFLGNCSSGADQPCSRLLMNNVYRLRPACTAAQQSWEVVNATARSAHWPHQHGQQLASFRTVDFKGRSFPDSLYLTDFSTDDLPRVQEGRGPLGGYAVRNTNTTRLCRYVVDPACLNLKSSDACVNDLIDKVLSGQVGAASGGCSKSKLAGVIAGPVVVGVAVLAALLGLLLWRRRRHRRLQREQLPRHKQYGIPGQGVHLRDSRETERGSRPEYHDSSGSPGGHVGSFTGIKGWEVTNEMTTPLIEGEDVSKLRFGELLGAGSFGRVYRAEWAGRPVAVKVIEHDGGTSAAVENEVELMLSFSHPNIVRAFYCVTFTKSGPSTTPAGTSAQGRSTAGGTQSTSQGSSSQGTSSRQHSRTPMQTQQHGDSLADSEAQLQTTGQLGNTVPSAALPSGTAAMNDSAMNASVAGGCSAAPAAVNTADKGTSGIETGWTIQPIGRSTGGAGASAGWWGTALDPAAASIGAGNAGSSLGVVAGSSKTQRAETWLVQEYCDCGTLGGIASHWNPAEESEQQMLLRLLLLQDCAQGLKVLHGRNVVHGDLNARNVLVASSASSRTGLCAKLADLGLSRVIKQHQTHRTTNTVGTMSHMPPELLRYGRMSAAADVYAFGVMLWEIFTGQPAFRKLHYGQFFETVVLRNLRPMIPAGMPADYQLLMEHCWATDPADRPSIDRVLECLRYMIHERHQSVMQPWPFAAAHLQHTSAPTSSVADRVPSLLVRQPQERMTKLRPDAQNPKSSLAKTPEPARSGSRNKDDLTQGSLDTQGYEGSEGHRGFAGSREGQESFSGCAASNGAVGGSEYKGSSDYPYEDGDADMALRYAKLQHGRRAAGLGARYQHFDTDSSGGRDSNQGLHAGAPGSDMLHSHDRWIV